VIFPQSDNEKKAIRAKIIAYVEELALPKSADELLDAYEGRENELLKNLTNLKAKKEKEAETIAEIKILVEELTLLNNLDELLDAYEGRENELLKNLTNLKAKKEDKAGTTVDTKC
jgi:hypothetical protein